MYKELKEELEHADDFYRMIEGGDIHLSVADKSALLMHLRQTNHANVHDVYYDANLFLWNMGYRSKGLELMMQGEKDWERLLVWAWKNKARGDE